MDNCGLSCILFPSKVTHKYLSKDLRSRKLMGSASREKQINSKLFILILPCCCLLGSLRNRSYGRRRWTDTEESLRVCKTLQLPVNPQTLLKESQVKPRENSCWYVSVTAEWSWWLVKTIANTRLMMGESLLLKCCPWLFIKLLVNLFSFLHALTNILRRILSAAVASYQRRWGEVSYKRRERILMDEKDGSCPCWLLLIWRCLPLATGMTGLSVWFGQTDPVPRSEPSHQTQPFLDYGIREGAQCREKKQRLVSMEVCNRASQIGVSRQHSCLWSYCRAYSLVILVTAERVPWLLLIYFLQPPLNGFLYICSSWLWEQVVS